MLGNLVLTGKQKLYLTIIMDYRQTLKVATKDLESFDMHELELMAKYHGIPVVDKKSLCKALARKIYEIKRGTMRRATELGIELLYTTRPQIMQAMAREEITRAEGRELLAGLAEPTPAVREERPLPSSAEDCTNVHDYFTQKRWSIDNLPEIKLRFLPADNLEGRPYVLCIDKDSLVKWLEQSDNEFRGWYPNTDNIAAGKDIESEGYGGRPSRYERFYKLPGIPDYVANSITEIKQLIRDNNVLVGYPIYTRKRLGNKDGVFGVGMIHGQEPGYTVYYVMAENMDVNKTLLDVARKIYMFKTGEDLPNVATLQEKPVKDILEKLQLSKILVPVQDLQDDIGPVEDELPVSVSLEPEEEEEEQSPLTRTPVDYSDLYSEDEEEPLMPVSLDYEEEQELPPLVDSSESEEEQDDEMYFIEALEYFVSQTSCTVMFVRKNDEDWEYVQIYCDVPTLEVDWIEYRDQGYTERKLIPPLNDAGTEFESVELTADYIKLFREISADRIIAFYNSYLSYV